MYQEKGRMMNSISRSRAFTLIELLVVISIIALLISILMPALRKARWQAMASACLSQAKMLNLGLLSYAVDTDGYYLPAVGAANGSYPNVVTFGGVYDSRRLLNDYVGPSEAFYCPDGIPNDRTTMWGAGWGGWDSGASFVTIDYMIVAGTGGPGNMLLYLDLASTPIGNAPWFRDGIYAIKRELDVLQPSRAPFLADHTRSLASGQMGGIVGAFWYNHSGLRNLNGLNVNRSQGYYGGNTLYFDGHGAWNNQDVMMSPTAPLDDDSVLYWGGVFWPF